MLYDHGVSFNYEKAWRAKEKAMESIRGKPDISYHLLLSYIYMLKKTNPGFVAELKTDAMNNFLTFCCFGNIN